MSIPNTLAFTRNINLANTTLSPTLLLHCALPHAVPSLLPSLLFVRARVSTFFRLSSKSRFIAAEQ